MDEDCGVGGKGDTPIEMKKYWNDQIYYECQLIALWNAAIYQGISVPFRYGLEYIEDCEEARALHGGAINVDKVIQKLQLEPVKGQCNWNWIKQNCPVEFKISCHRGWHSVLMVDVDVKKRKVLLANYAKGRVQWLKIDRLLEMNKRQDPFKWAARRD